MLLVVGDVHVGSELGVCGDFVNLKNLLTQYSKMFIEIEFVYVCS